MAILDSDPENIETAATLLERDVTRVGGPGAHRSATEVRVRAGFPLAREIRFVFVLINKPRQPRAGDGVGLVDLDEDEV